MIVVVILAVLNLCEITLLLWCADNVESIERKVLFWLLSHAGKGRLTYALRLVVLLLSVLALGELILIGVLIALGV